MAELRQLPFYDRHAALGARFGEFAGWQMAIWYTSAIEEHLAVRQRAGVFDISHMGRFRVAGMDAADIAGLFTRDPSRAHVGASVYTLACNEAGGIVDDLIIYRVRDDEYLVVCNAANADKIGDRIAIASATSALTLVDLQQAGTVLLAVQGPAAVGLVAGMIGGGEAESIPRHGCREIVKDGVNYLLARTGYTGEDGFEVMTSKLGGGQLFDQLIATGECLPCGLAARDSLRLEAALPLHGADIDETTTPWEAGLGWTVELDRDFYGREALVRTRDTVERRLTCLQADGPGVIRGHCDVYDGDDAVGLVTSGGFSPLLDTSIALAYLPRAVAQIGRELSVDLRGRRLPCHVVKRPFYTRPA